MASRLIDSLWVAHYGSACAGGSVRFYAPGTTTPVNVFQDDAATVVVTQPVSLDSNGRTTVPIYSITPMRAILYSSSGAQVVDIERIDGDRAELVAIDNTGWPNADSLDEALTLLSTSFGADDGQIAVSGSGAVPRSLQSKLSEQRSVDDFGAVGDGITDDFPAITAAITAVNASGGGTLLIPPGTYLISQALVLRSGVSLRGAGSAYSVIKNSSTTGNGITATSINSFVLEDFAVTASTLSSGKGIFLDSCAGVTLSRLSVAGHLIALDTSDATFASNSQTHRIRDCILLGDGTTVNGRGVRMTATNGISGKHQLSGNEIGATGGSLAGAAVEITGALIGVTMIGNYGSAEICVVGVLINAAFTGSGLILVGNRFKDNGTYGLSVGPTAGSSFLLFEYANQWSNVNNLSDNVGTVFASSFSGAVPNRPIGASGYTQTSAISVSASVNLLRGNVIEINATGGGTTITIPAPAVGATGMGGNLTFICANNSGGAVTWTFNAVYHTSAAVAPVTGSKVAITFVNVPGVVDWYEIGRATVT